MNAINRETIDQYFSLLKNVLDEHNLAANPERIYNVDETGTPLDFKTPNIVAKTGSKKVRYRQVTIVACASAVGQALAPLVIFNAKNLNPAWTRNEVSGSKYGLSDKG